MKKDKFNEYIYTQIGYDDLVTYSLFSLIKKGKDPTFENLVVECFELFPKRFSLVGYSMYPDSALVNKSWLRCRTDKNLIAGSTAKGFKLTSEGVEIAEKVSHLLKDSDSKPTINKMKSDERTRAGRFVGHVENSNAYRKYCNKDIDNITEFDVRDLLLGTMQTEPRILRENLDKLREYASIYERHDIIELLRCIEKYLQDKFGFEEREAGYKGGMNKKKIHVYTGKQSHENKSGEVKDE